MTELQRAEAFLDMAEREEEAGDIAALSERNADAEAHYERARLCRLQGIEILERVTKMQKNKKKRTG